MSTERSPLPDAVPPYGRLEAVRRTRGSAPFLPSSTRRPSPGLAQTAARSSTRRLAHRDRLAPHGSHDRPLARVTSAVREPTGAPAACTAYVISGLGRRLVRLSCGSLWKARGHGGARGGAVQRRDRAGGPGRGSADSDGRVLRARARSGA